MQSGDERGIHLASPLICIGFERPQAIFGRFAIRQTFAGSRIFWDILASIRRTNITSAHSHVRQVASLRRLYRSPMGSCSGMLWRLRRSWVRRLPDRACVLRTARWCRQRPLHLCIAGNGNCVALFMKWEKSDAAVAIAARERPRRNRGQSLR